jgi:hypothetical protein
LRQISRDTKALKAMSQLFVFDLARSDLACAKSLFRAFNNISKNDKSQVNGRSQIRFLFTARERQLKNVIESDPDTNRDFIYAQNEIERIDITFNFLDATLFFKKAI